MISYAPFHTLLYKRQLRKTDVMRSAGISNATMARLSSGKPVSLDVIDKLCRALDCQPFDIIEYTPNMPGSKQSKPL
jgi:DNA-binding Xre family transcriptional regulator